MPNMDKTDKQANCLKLKKVEIKDGFRQWMDGGVFT